MVEMKQVYSSHVDEIGYDDEKEELVVKFSGGRTAVYEGVPVTVAANVMSAASIGRALAGSVRGRYRHRYI